MATHKETALDVDIVVIGGGGCGMAAAIAASELGTRVALLEKRGIGGNSAFANGLFAIESNMQKSMGINVSKDKMFRSAMEHAQWKTNPRIIRAFLNKSGDTINWLEEKGLKFRQVLRMPPSGVKTWHLWTPKGAPSELIRVLRQGCEDRGIKIFTNNPAKEILRDSSGRVSGVLASSKDNNLRFTTKSVIIATGGYGANKELLKKYCPFYHENLQHGGVPNMGDGLLMAMEIGAATEGLGNLLMHPHAYNDKGQGHVGLFAFGMNNVLVNARGERFADETISAVMLPNIELKQLGMYIYTLFDEKIKKSIIQENKRQRGLRWEGAMEGTILPDLNEELQKVVTTEANIKKADSWEEMAKWIGCAPEVLRQTIEEYNSFCDDKYDPIFNRPKGSLKALRTPPYYGFRCFPAFLTTLGGIKVNHNMEVLDKDDSPIPGLYAGGDTAGGWETDTYNGYLLGHALGFAINSGRIAGESAAKFVGKA